MAVTLRQVVLVFTLWATASPLLAQQAAPAQPQGQAQVPGAAASAAAPVIAAEPEPVLPPAVANALRAAKISPANIGIYVQEVGGARPVLSVNPDKPMNPASVMKLVTTYAALELMGPSYIWRTGIYETGTRRGDILDGDLVFKGTGDPKLTQEELWMALKAVRARGIREVRGNFVLDRGAFDVSTYDAAKFDGDPLRAYNAGPDALLLNLKAYQITFAPDEASATVNVTVEPRTSGLPVRSNVRLVQGNCTDMRAPQLKTRIDATGIAIEGNYALSCGVRSMWVHPFELSSAQYASTVLRQLWADAGGTLAGDVRNGPVSAGARLVFEIESESLAEVIRDINKHSNNVMARQLFLSISSEVLRLPGSQDRSYRAVKSWFTGKRIGGDELVMENGSGLSRIERISAQSLGRMLVAAFRSPVMPEFMSSMPLVAYDGTMRRRLTTRDVAGQAHIKTGTLNEVRAIGGYVLAASGKRYSVVFLVNGLNAPAAQQAQDALLQWVYADG